MSERDNDWSPNPFDWSPQKFRDWARWQPNELTLLRQRVIERPDDADQEKSL